MGGFVNAQDGPNIPETSADKPVPMDVDAPRIGVKLPDPGKIFTFVGKDATVWVGVMESRFQYLRMPEESKVGFAEGSLGVEIASHWQAEKSGKSVTWKDMSEFILKYYGELGGSVEARRRWHEVKQGSRTVIEYIREFMAKMAIVISIEKSVAEGEKVLTFYRGLRHSMQKLCSFDPLVQGPFQSLDALISTAKARDDTHSPQESASRTPNSRPHRNTNSNQGHATVHMRGRGRGVSKRTGFRVRCHACRQVGHIRANCPYRGNASEASAPRHSGPGGHNGNRRGKGPGDVNTLASLWGRMA